MNLRIWRFLPLLWLSCAPGDRLAPLRVSVLYPVEGSGQGGMAVGMRQGMIAARVGSDFVAEEHAPANDDEARELLAAALAPSQGRRLVITGGEVYREALDERACDLGGAEVLQLGAKPSPCANLRSVVFDSFAPAFQAAVLALAAENIAPRLLAGIISTVPSFEDSDLIAGFQAGAEYVGGGVQTLEIESFDEAELSDPEATRAEISALADAVDVLLVVGDAQADLILDAVREQNEAHPERVLRVVGVDEDLAVLDLELTLGSVVRRFDMEVRSTILATEVDTFSPGQVVYGFPDGQTELLVNSAYASTPLAVAPFAFCASCATLGDAVAKAEAASLRAASTR
jgi:basic membrane lipoprotein Med (substrate-binding protein (PBP1-ABC) superfamily)